MLAASHITSRDVRQGMVIVVVVRVLSTSVVVVTVVVTVVVVVGTVGCSGDSIHSSDVGQQNRYAFAGQTRGGERWTIERPRSSDASSGGIAGV